MLTQIRQDSCAVTGREPGVGVVVAQDPTHAGQRILAELTSRLIVPQLQPGSGKNEGQTQGVGVIVTEDPTAVGQGVLAELTSRSYCPNSTS